MSGKATKSARNTGSGVKSGTPASGSRKNLSSRENSFQGAAGGMQKAETEGRPLPIGLNVLDPGNCGDVAAKAGRPKSNFGSVPPRSVSSLSQNRVVTPTKHVLLTAVRRKQENEAPITPDLDWREFTRSNSSLRFGSRSYSSLSREQSQDDIDKLSSLQHEAEDLSTIKELSSQKQEPGMVAEMEDMPLSDREPPPPSSSLSAKDSQPVERAAAGKKDQDDDEDSEDEDDDSEEEIRKAPNELLMEFLDCVMKKDFVNAEKLCRMILIYEPNNPEALMFHPVILEKMHLDAEAAAEGEEESGDEGDEEEDDGDDDDDEDDDDSDDSSSEGDEENEDAGAVEEGMPARPDSGIGM